MPISLYRLHTKACSGKYKRTDRAGKDCRCMIHAEGKLGDTFVRSSTKTRAWTKATRLIQDAETRGIWADPEADREDEQPAITGKPVAEAVDEFLADAEDPKGRNLDRPTMVKYRTLLRRLAEFCQRRGLSVLSQLDFSELTTFKREWPTGTLATEHNISRLRTFFSWCVRHKWVDQNVAESLEMPKEAVVERLPYTPDEMAAILDAARTIKLDPQQRITNAELETFILLMRWSGIAISDAALLEVSELRGDEIRLYRNKSRRNAKRVLVVVPLPPEVLKRIKALPLIHKRHYFAHGTPTLAAQVEAWRKRLKFVFAKAGIINAGSHRFRHTFATDLLEKGVSLELVSRWLGHASIKVTEKHYSHFIESRIRAASNVLRDLYKGGREPDA